MPSFDIPKRLHAAQHGSDGPDPITPASIGAYTKTEVDAKVAASGATTLAPMTFDRLPEETNLAPSPDFSSLSSFSPASGVTLASSPRGGALMTWAAGGAAQSPVILAKRVDGGGNWWPVAAGEEVTVALEFEAGQDCQVLTVCDAYDASYGWKASMIYGLRPVKAGERATMIATGRNTISGATQHDVNIAVRSLTGANMPANVTVRLLNLTVVKGPLRAGPFTGDDPGCWWNGLPGSSTSGRRVALPKPGSRPQVAPRPVTLATTSAYDSPRHPYAPAASPAGPAQIFTASSPWNLPASTLTVLPNSAAIISYLDAGTVGWAVSGPNREGWEKPTYYVDKTTPRHAVTYDNANGWDANPPWFSSVPIPVGAKVGNNDDGEMTIVDLDEEVVYWLWRASFDGTTWRAQAGSKMYLDGSGVAAQLPGGDPRNVANGQNGKHGYMNVTWAEVLRGPVTRVTRYACPNTVGKANPPLWPLIYSDGLSTNANAVPHGSILRLKPSINIASKYPALSTVARNLVAGWQSHGLLLCDSGGADTLQIAVAETTTVDPVEVWPGRLASELNTIPLADLEVCYRPAP